MTNNTMVQSAAARLICAVNKRDTLSAMRSDPRIRAARMLCALDNIDPDSDVYEDMDQTAACNRGGSDHESEYTPYYSMYMNKADLLCDILTESFAIERKDLIDTINSGFGMQ